MKMYGWVVYGAKSMGSIVGNGNQKPSVRQVLACVGCRKARQAYDIGAAANVFGAVAMVDVQRSMNTPCRCFNSGGAQAWAYKGGFDLRHTDVRYRLGMLVFVVQPMYITIRFG
jgi:hypothetical protein